MINGKVTPSDVTDAWTDILDDIEMNVVPLNYVHSISITFKNNQVWVVDVKKKSKTQDWNTLELEIKTMIKQYEDDIYGVDFKLDTDKIKRDISRSIKKLSRNKKIK